MREPMREALILVRKERARDAISRLAALRAIHITPHTPMRVREREVVNGTPTEVAESLSSSLTKVRWLLSRILDGEEPPRAAVPIHARLDLIETLATSYGKLERERDRITKEQEILRQRQAVLDLLEGAEIPLVGLWKPRSTRAVLTETPVHPEGALAMLPCKGGMLSILPAGTTVPEAIDLSPVHGLSGTRDAALRRTHAALSGLDRDLTRVRSAMDGFVTHRAFLIESERDLAYALIQAEAPLLFGESASTIIIKGFIPVSRAGEIAARFADLPSVIETVEVEDAPILLRNPTWARPFELLLSMYATPRYREIDPTVFMAIAFPLFFGFMLGDVGYGLLVMLLAALLPRMIRGAHAFSRILLLSGGSSVLFGVLFGELFGFELFHPLLHRADDLITLLGIAIGIGIVHVNLGLVLGIINESRKEGIFFGLYAKGGWILLQVAAVMLASAYGASLPLVGAVAKPAAYLTLAIAVLLIYGSERTKGLIELPMIFSHVLSYARLAAIGLASVSLAFVVNDLGRGMVASGGLAVVWGVLLLLVGHTVNLALGMLGPFLHSLRLHYAEFFMKFYEGGGRPFKPFGEVGS